MVNIIVKGRKIKVKGKKLNLSRIGITDISQIEGLELLTNLKKLDLSENEITEIKGLDNLTNLFNLNLSFNKITEIKGLENLRNLVILNLSSNNISEIKGCENLTSLSILNLKNNKFTDIKGLENLTKLVEINLGLEREPKWGIKTSGFNLNGKIIPWNIAKKMGIGFSKGSKRKGARISIRLKKIVKYCQFVKETGNVDFTSPGILDVYNEWEKLH